VNAPSALSDADAKALGAYYTDAQVAEFLVDWAIRDAADTVLDPSFGGGVFLRSACKRIQHLGGSPVAQVFGVEIDASTHGRIADKLDEEFGLERGHLIEGDFFSHESLQVNVVVGNPPFIRYQKFNGVRRSRALARARGHELKLSGLSSSWLPFLLLSIASLKLGGRLAMVLPVEITHAAYARPALRALASSFADVAVITFQKKLFPDLSEDVLLVLADRKGEGPARFCVRDLVHAGQLADAAGSLPSGSTPFLARDLEVGQQRFAEYLLSEKARNLYRTLKAGTHVWQLGKLAKVGIGYVTGANDYFHLHPDQAKLWRIPEQFLRPAVRRGRSLAGLEFSSADWIAAAANGGAGYLLYLEPGDKPTSAVRRYLANGEAAGVHNAFKCRAREPWYCVPGVRTPDALLSYMSGATPRLVANTARVVAPNSLHVVHVRAGSPMKPQGLASLWLTSLTRLSAEIEGHALGGGMLKLEPGEARNVLLPAVSGSDQLPKLLPVLDDLLRNRGYAAAAAEADRVILRDGIGLSVGDCRTLRDAAETLRQRRYSR